MAAAEIIRDWLITGDFPDRMITDQTPNRAFVTELVYGTARHRRTIKWITEQFASQHQDPSVTACLFIGIYQLLFMSETENYAAVNETVNTAKEIAASKGAPGFINAVLRNVIRSENKIRADLEKLSIGIRESHPDILVYKWTSRFGPEKTLELCRYNNTRPKVTITPNTLKTNFNELLEKITGQGIKAIPHPAAPEEFMIIPTGTAPSEIPGYNEGLFTIQDPATSWAVQLLNPLPGETILDACAAPGGKTALIAQHTQDKGQITAIDLHEDRLKILRQNIERLQISSVTTVKCNAGNAEEIKTGFPETLFDRILLDVPCTNTGVLRRRPDARWRFTSKRLKKMTDIQLALLNNISAFLKPGGTLVYSTCSIEPEENENQIGIWLANNPHFTKENEKRIFPSETDTDGIYAAALKRTL